MCSMNIQPIKPRKKVSRRVIIFAVVALSPLLLWGLLLICVQLAYWPIRAEITHIAQVSGIKPLSVECNMGIDIGTECLALYSKLSYDEHSMMLTSSGYTIVPNPNKGSDYIVATNSKVHMYASGSTGYQGSGYEDRTRITYQLNDYHN